MPVVTGGLGSDCSRPRAGGRGPQVDAVNRPFEIQLPSMDMPRYGFVLLAALPTDAVSRAYLKMQEALLWSEFNLNPGERCVEIGSAPGGASLA